MTEKGFDRKLEVVFCRKCNVPMEKTGAKIQTTEGNTAEWPFYCIPQLGVSPTIALINAVKPVEVFVCPKCRLVEMYSAGRGGAES